MKLILILVISILSVSANGQINPINNKPLNSIIPSVEYVKTNDSGRQPAYFINGKFANPTILSTISPQHIDSIYVEKKEIEIDDIKYIGQVHLTMKEGYNPGFISLSDLKSKHSIPANNSTIFMIDNKIIKDDYNNYIVDEKYILKIIVDKFENEEENLNITIVQLLTKSDENIKKSKEIIIRGAEEVALIP